GIRDRNVTGVQTCALPISPRTTAGSGLSAGGVDIHPRRYAIRSSVSQAQRRYLLLEQGVGAAGFNFLLNAAIAWLMFRGADVVRSEERRVGKGCRVWVGSW